MTMTIVHIPGRVPVSVPSGLVAALRRRHPGVVVGPAPGPRTGREAPPEPAPVTRMKKGELQTLYRERFEQEPDNVATRRELIDLLLNGGQ